MEVVSSTGAGGADLAIDSEDRTTVVWGLHDAGLFPTLQMARIGANGIPGAAHSLTPRTEEAQVAVGPTGSATIVGVQYPATPSGSSKVLAIHVTADGSSAVVSTVFSKAGWYGSEPQVAVDSQGRATVVWSSSSLGETRVESARLSAAGVAGEAQTLSNIEDHAREPQVDVDPQDRATVAWTGGDGIQAVRIDSDGVPGEAQAISAADADAFLPDLAVDSQGRATVVWRSGPESDVRIQGARIGADGVPGQVNTLSGSLGILPDPQVEVDSQDRAWVLWSRQEGEWEEFRWSVQATRLNGAGAAGPVLTLSGPEARRDTAIAADGQGRAWVAWREGGISGAGIVKTVRLGSDGNPGSVQAVTAEGANSQSPRIVVDSIDRPRFAWVQPDQILTRRGEPTPPETQIDSEVVTWPSITFAFSSPDPDAAGFQCNLDQVGFEPCLSPVTYTEALGVTHTFEVRAEGEEGLDPTPASTSFAIFARPNPPTDPAPPATPVPLPPPPYSARSLATAAAVATVRRGEALLRLRCPNGSRCRGTAKLVVKLAGAGQARSATIGRAAFDIRGGETASVGVALTGRGRSLLRQAKDDELKVSLTGVGLKPRSLRLRSAAGR